MIKATDVTMKFHAPGKEPFVALNKLSCEIPRGCIYGMIGANGAGKSTFLRLLAGVYRPCEGSITVDDMPVWENPAAKSRIVYIPDDLYFLPQSSMKTMARLYRALYPNFDFDRFDKLTETFQLDPTANVNTFSKGMRRQAATILGLSCMPDYLFFDETFDGLDPVMRNLVKDVIRADAKDFGTTVIIASHSLRELEDVCDQLSLLHKGGIVFESQMSELKTSLFKVQFALSTPYDESLFETRLHERSSIRAAPGENLAQSVYDIGNADTYGQLVYVRGSYLFRMLYEGLGEDLFFQALGEYYAKHAFSIATGDDLWAAFSVYLRPYTAKSLHDSVFAGLQ